MTWHGPCGCRTHRTLFYLVRGTMLSIAVASKIYSCTGAGFYSFFQVSQWHDHRTARRLTETELRPILYQHVELSSPNFQYRFKFNDHCVQSVYRRRNVSAQRFRDWSGEREQQSGWLPGDTYRLESLECHSGVATRVSMQESPSSKLL